jgi:hypothetical protein
MKNRAITGLILLLVAGLPMLAQASEVDHIMASVFSLIKVAAYLVIGVVLVIFLLIKVLTRK